MTTNDWQTEKEQLLKQIQIERLERELLFQIALNLSAATSPDDLAELVYKFASQYGAGAVSLFYFDLDDTGYPEWAELVAVKNDGAEILMPVGTRFYLPELPMATIWLNNASNTQFIEDAHTDTEIDDITRMVFTSVDAIATAMVRLYTGVANWIGVMNITWDKPHTFIQLEKSIYKTIAVLLAPTVENIRMRYTLEQRVDERTKALQVATQRAEESSRLKSEFIATVTHELRTPLNAIEGFSSIMLSGMGVELPPHALRMMERISVNSKNLIAIINDILDLSRIEAGLLQPARLPFKPAYLLIKWQEQIRILAQQKNITTSFILDPNLPTILLGDEDAIGKIAMNLLMNAVKFTPSGGFITLTFAPAPEPNYFQLIVTDTGIGIPPEAHSYIFDAFRQVDQSSTREYGGTGLGLTIVKRLTDVLSGNITLTSTLNEGTTFIINLPMYTIENQGQ
ncbi:MAG: ATP-binding protein [bacterium]|nr:ATP-binding protein [bacterium]